MDFRDASMSYLAAVGAYDKGTLTQEQFQLAAEAYRFVSTVAPTGAGANPSSIHADLPAPVPPVGVSPGPAAIPEAQQELASAPPAVAPVPQAALQETSATVAAPAVLPPSSSADTSNELSKSRSAGGIKSPQQKSRYDPDLEHKQLTAACTAQTAEGKPIDILVTVASASTVDATVLDRGKQGHVFVLPGKPGRLLAYHEVAVSRTRKTYEMALWFPAVSQHLLETSPHGALKAGDVRLFTESDLVADGAASGVHLQAAVPAVPFHVRKAADEWQHTRNRKPAGGSKGKANVMASGGVAGGGGQAQGAASGAGAGGGYSGMETSDDDGADEAGTGEPSAKRKRRG
jgi:hypothetical protein